jgi:endonuclease-8
VAQKAYVPSVGRADATSQEMFRLGEWNQATVAREADAGAAAMTPTAAVATSSDLLMSGSYPRRASLTGMPEGDSLRVAAQRLQALVGERLHVETPHPRAAATGVAPKLDGRRLERVEAQGKNLLLRFEGGLVLRSHLRMRGRWQVWPRGTRRFGRPWLVLQGREREAVLWNGPVLELHTRATDRLGPDILAEPPDLDAILIRLRRDPDHELGDSLLDQRLVAGIGNLWKAEALWEARVSPWRRVRDVSDAELRAVLEAAHRLMRASVEGHEVRRIYRRPGRPCPRCGAPIRSHGQGDANRTAYWCPRCQEGERLPAV